MESTALKTFRRKMANPLHWRKANQIFTGYTKSDLQSVERTKQLVSRLASEFGVPLTSREQTEAAKWLVAQGIDPSSKRDRLMIWKKSK